MQMLTVRAEPWPSSLLLTSCVPETTKKCHFSEKLWLCVFLQILPETNNWLSVLPASIYPLMCPSYLKNIIFIFIFMLWVFCLSFCISMDHVCSVRKG